METQVEKYMRLLECDKATAESVIADDKAIDKGAKLFEQTAEQKANSKLYRQGDRKPTVYKFDKRERKADSVKQELISLMVSCLRGTGVKLEITNPERQIDFEYQGRKYRIVLSAPRS